MSPGDRIIELAMLADAAVLLQPAVGRGPASAAWGGPEEWIVAEAPTIGLAVADLVPLVEGYRARRIPPSLVFTPIASLIA